MSMRRSRNCERPVVIMPLKRPTVRRSEHSSERVCAQTSESHYSKVQITPANQKLPETGIDHKSGMFFGPKKRPAR